MRQRFIQSFSTSGTEQTAIDEGLVGKPYVCYIQDGQYIDWNTKGRGKGYYKNLPLTFEILTGGTISFVRDPNGPEKIIEYSLDDGATWNSLTSATQGSSFTVQQGDIVQFRGNNETYATDFAKGNSFTGGAYYNVYGNIMSLIDPVQYRDMETFPENSTHNFYKLFRFAYVVDASNLILPVTSLTTACYNGMFSSCYHLVAGPDLPATNLAQNCYGSMFSDCRELVKAPVLPAETLAKECYSYMFTYDVKLEQITCLARTRASNDTTNWVGSINGNGTFVKHPNATWSRGSAGVPKNWTIIDADI